MFLHTNRFFTAHFPEDLRGEKTADAEMSVYSDASNEDLSDELETLGWYHYDLSRHAAEALLLSNGADGSYLLRSSNDGPGCFALSVRSVT
ncbi:hypothetical protein GOODEAATRI_017529 [Goodea atripinnis]|uniref:SH2 domain-containing protein n=1 Tax=Goodea atripinnis TaxID=208336 RepID=A0ABV0PYU3_9TELE